MQMRFSNMTDSMKFGPEWLRNLSSEGSTGVAPKYQLAEHRYGREEMLALFDRNVKPPDSLTKLQGLFVEKTQMPMALLTMTEEETRQWNRGINSDAVLRVAGKAPLGLPGGLRGRGGSVDRGRGRSRGSGGFHYTRGLSYDETSDGIKDGPLERGGFSRGGRYDRSQGGERGWSERNGGDSGDWNGSTSPRKEYSGMKDYSGSRGIDNWRRHRGSGEDEEGWRKSEKWGRSNSWRDEGDGNEGGGPKSSSRTSSWGRGWADEGLRGRGRDDDEPSRRGFIDEVPEWAMENPSESGGSFDASGAFHGGTYSDEEDDNIGPRKSKNRYSDDPDSRNQSKSPPPIKKSIRHEHNDYDDEYDEPHHSPKDRKLSRSQTAQGNLSDSSSKPVPIPVSKSQSSSNIKTSETSETSMASSKRTESHNFDRIRVQHQNFVDKNSTNKDVSDSDDLNDFNKHNHKKDAGESGGVSDNKTHHVNSETNLVQDISNLRDKNLIHSKDSLNSKINSGARLIEEERDRGAPVNRQGSEEDMERMAEVVKDTVVKLFEDEEKPQVEGDKWYYRDPQGVVQGPFRSTEMLEWFINGYFQLSLLVRREQDKVYVKLGDLMKKCGNKIPFLPGINLPVISPENEPPQPQPQQQPPPPPPPTSVQPQPPNLNQSEIIMQQYHQYQLLQKQILLNQQLAINKLSQSETWNTLSPVQQRSLLMQKLQLSQQPTLEQFAQMEKNPLSQLIAQVQMQQQQQNKVPIPDAREIGSANNVDPVRQLMQQMNLLQANQPPVMPSMNPSNVVFNHHLAQQVHLNSVMNNPVLNPTPPLKVEENKAEDPIQSLLRQLGNQQAQLGNQQKVMVQPDQGDSLWGAPGRPQTWPQGNPPVANPPNLPLWEIKTEQQILAEQQLRLEEERKQEELRLMQEQDEAVKKQRELEIRRMEEEKKEELKKLEMKRLEEEKARKIKELKDEEDRKRAEELKLRQIKEALKKKQEEAQKKKEEKERKKEEERERKRLLEEEKKRIEIEIRKKEEEASRRRQEEEEEAKRQEQHKRQIEALKRLQEQQMKSKIAPWSQSNVTMGTSLADIQKLQEKEKKQIMREQAAIVAQIAHQNELQMQREAESRSNGLNLKWAEQMPKMSQHVKSLAEIQAEEQLQLSKQQEKERLERLQQQRESSIPPTAGIWGTASQSLSWTNNNSPWGVNSVQQNSTPGFWDEVAPVSSKIKTKTPSSPLKSKPTHQHQQQQQVQHQQQQHQHQQQQQASNQKQAANSGSNQKQTKVKPKKEEVAVLKLFEQHGDEFTTWCSSALQALDTEVDIPTFVTFLRDVDSPYEVKDYVKLYLGEGKEASEFAKQFLERRSRWRSAQKANSGDDDMSLPSQAINPNSQYQNAAQEFQVVKGKGKKNKKGKMLKVDSRILGFSVTAAPDRINVGDRDYVDHNL